MTKDGISITFKGNVEEFITAMKGHITPMRLSAAAASLASKTIKGARYNDGQNAAYDSVLWFLDHVKINK